MVLLRYSVKRDFDEVPDVYLIRGVYFIFHMSAVS
jgi:hypothetical protein